MGMSVGGKAKGPVSEINVTPLVDVTLVLLIIFMVMTPLMQMGYDAQVPPKPPDNYVPPPSQTQDQVIVTVAPGGSLYINKEKIAASDFPRRIQEVIQNRKTEMVFFSCDKAYNYGEAMKLMDLIKAAGGEDKSVQVGIILEPVPVPTA